jgi:hypothetical protein
MFELMTQALPSSEAKRPSRAEARRAEIRATAYLDAKPTSLSPIALGSSEPPLFIQQVAESSTVYRRIDNRLRVLEQMPVGPALASALVALAGQGLGSDGAIRATVLWQKLAAWSTAQAMVTTKEALDAFDLTLLNPELKIPLTVGQELACAANLSLSAAMTQINLTTQVADSLPKSWVALDRGDWTITHLRELAKVTVNCPPQVAMELEARIVPEAIRRGWTPPEVSKQALRLLLAIDPDGAAERARKAKKNADVTFNPCPDETATVTSYGDAVMLRRVIETINAAAAAMRRGDDERTVGQRRFDALATAVLGQQSRTGSSRPAAQALIAISAETIAGGEAPGDLAGYGPISAASARELATNAIWRKLILDPGTGTALDLGMSAYRPNEPLIRFVKARDWKCRFPGCQRPAEQCDCDHRIDHHDDGPTDRWNLQMLCRLHHNAKTCKLWRSVLDEGTGEVVWTSPFGHEYRVEPHRFLELLNEPDDDEDLDGSAEPVVPSQALDEPDPPWPDEPPPISFDELEEYLQIVDQLEADEWFRANQRCDALRRASANANA